MFRFTRLTIVALGLALLGAPAARAQGLIVPNIDGRIRPIPLPRPTPVPVQPLSLKSQNVKMEAVNGALKVQVEQVFYNPNSRPMEGTYLFPLPAGATVSSFRLLIDKEPVEGKILSIEEARRVYESYVRRNIDPAILEWVGRNAFQANVFPIPGGGERRIYLTYTQAAEFQNGIYKLEYPLNSERVTNSSAGDLVLDCTIKSQQPIKAVYSPTHEIQVKRDDDHLAHATFEGRDVRANRDFLIYYSTSEKAFGLNALTHRRMGDDGYVMLMLAPKREVAAAEVQPKDVVLVFDTSGSMQGAKIEQAKKAALTIVDALNDKDRFNVIRFSSDTTSFKESVVPASKSNRDAARAFVNDFKAVGGTAIDDALQAGLASIPKDDERRGRAPFLIFMTDGLPTIGTTEIDKILGNAQKAAPKDLRMFSFGVGADVNTLLLDRLAGDNHGAADYATADEDLETKIGGFYAKISDPVLSNVKVELNGAPLKEVYPSKIPDIFAGTQLLVLGRYAGTGKGTVTLTGEVNGKPQRFTYDLNLPERENGSDFIPKLWAGRRIGFLLEEIRLHGESKELKDEVIRLSKEHGIVTPYTSYLVEEPGMQPNQPITRFGLGLEDRAAGGAPRGAGNLGGSGFGGGGFGGRPTDAVKAPAGPQGPQGPRGATGPVKAESAAKPQQKDANQYGYLDQDLKRRGELQQQARQQADGYYRSTGANAVEASKRVQQLKEKKVADSEVEVSRNVNGRAFHFSEGNWRDGTVQAKSTPVLVKYGSDAYFQLISRNADWARYLSAGRNVTFRSGKTAVVTVGEKGKEKLTEAELKELEK